MRVLLFVPPLVQLIIFGYAVNLDVEDIRIAWMDLDSTPQSRDLLASFQGSGDFEVVALPGRRGDARPARPGQSHSGVIRVLPGFARDIERQRPTAVQVLVDGTNSNTASMVSQLRHLRSSRTTARRS